MLPSRGRRAFLLTTCALSAATLLLPCLAAEYAQKNVTETPGFTLLPGISSVPAPVRVAPDQDWLGIDGAWNTFSLLVGDPQDSVRVFVSTASQQIWVVNRLACISNITDPNTRQITQFNVFDPNCESSRGFLYNTTDSTTWQQKGYYQLWIEKGLGLVGNGLYGFDSVGLGLPGEEGLSVQNTTLGTMVTPNFWLGHIGVHPKPTNFSAFEDPVPSYLTNLFNQKNIPSLSFGYTAGAQYHGQTVLASLTLGGYDASRIIPNDLTFVFAPDNARDLVVGLVGLTAKATNTSNINLLKRDDVTMFVDSTVAELWLPVEICKAFEDAFGLVHDTNTDLYLVDDTLHQSLLTQNPSITFTLGQKYSTDNTVQITLPYGAFDLEASPPYRGLQEKTKYFPIRRGNDSTQWVLGRTFLQEAYLTVDWERQNFSVSAVNWTYGQEADLIPIVSPQYAVMHDHPPKKLVLSTAATIGIAVGGGFTFALIMCAIGWWFWRRRHKRNLEAIKAKYEADAAAAVAVKKNASENSDEPPRSPTQDTEGGIRVFPKAELPGDSVVHNASSTSSKDEDPLAINEADNTERRIFEMPGDMPERQEAGGRQLSEKESMMVRERIYNGVDPNSHTNISPTVQEPLRRLAPVSSSEVTMVNERLPSNNNVSPITPRTPTARDGAFLEATDTFFQFSPFRPPREGRQEGEDDLLSPVSPLEGPSDTSRRRFSYES